MAGLLIFLFIGLTLGRPDPRINLDEDRLDNPDERGELFQGDMIIDFDPYKKNAIRSKLWPSGRIPYQFDSQYVSQFTSTDKSRIQQAIDDYSKYTCLRWVPKTSSDTAYVNIIRGQGCYSSVGRTGRQQTLSLGRGCTGKGTVIHEMMHAVGFHHEQCRTDRDSYVTIKYENIQDGMEYNFQKYTVQQIQDLGAKYDYGSVMHYSAYAFSKNRQATIVPKQQGATIGNRAGFSNTDIFKINKLYQCSPVGTGAPVTRAPVTTIGPRVVYNKFVCNFDTNDCGFLQEQNDDKFDWTRIKGGTPSGSTGPTGDHTSGNGYYMFIESSSPRVVNDNARLTTPEIKGLVGTYCLQFWYNMNGNTMGKLYVWDRMMNSNTITRFWVKSGHQGTNWVYAKIQRSATASFIVMFEGVRGSDYTSDIAVDDISITPGVCPGAATTPLTKATTKPTITVQPTTVKPAVLTSDLSCTFDSNTCNFIQDKDDQFDWTWKSGATASQITGPTGDHTSGTGKYMYIEASTPRVQGDIARLTSPTLSFNGKYCLKFAYHMYGSAQGTLNVYLVTGSKKQVIFSVNGDKGNAWFTTKGDVTFSGNSQIMFEGIRGSSFISDAAIDDVFVTKGECTSVITQAPTTVPTTAQPGTLLKGGFSCDFENGLCGITQQTTDDFDWALQQGSTVSSGTGPSSDHTTGTGKYMYAEASSPQATGNVAIFATPEISDLTSVYCVSFWYHMYGTSMGTLNVYGSTTSRTQKIFIKSGNQNDAWQHATVDVAYTTPVMIKFEAIRGSTWSSDIAIDDIKITPGKCLTTTPTRATLFQCDFEKDFCGMKNYKLPASAQYNWVRYSGNSPSSNTGPTTDNTCKSTTCYYVYTEASSPAVQGDKSLLDTPSFTAPGSATCLQFYYNLHGVDIDTLNVYALNGPIVGTPIWTIKGNLGDKWVQKKITITKKDVTYIRFETVRGVNYRGDIALDDVSLKTGACT